GEVKKEADPLFNQRGTSWTSAPGWTTLINTDWYVTSPRLQQGDYNLQHDCLYFQWNCYATDNKVKQFFIDWTNIITSLIEKIKEAALLWHMNQLWLGDQLTQKQYFTAINSNSNHVASSEEHISEQEE
ncbi:hypothetical protein ACJX0J_013358, partial [Zea mays]